MSEERIRKIFAERLKSYMEARGKQPVDLVNDLKLPFSTVSSWLSGQKLPRMGKIELLASYLGCEKSDLLEEKQQTPGYYLNDDARDLAQFLFDNPEYKVLFDASRKVKAEDIQFVKEMIERTTNS